MTDWQPKWRKGSILRSALHSISKGKPDTKLGPRLDAYVPELVNRGWLQICGCSDGDYVVITDKGREVLADD